MDSKCSSCKSSPCCGFTAISVPTPKTNEEYDVLLFHVSHKNVEVLKQGDSWLVLFRTPCEHLTDDGLCGIYENRPNMCRIYSNMGCEVDVPIASKADKHFRNRQELLKYLDEINTENTN